MQEFATVQSLFSCVQKALRVTLLGGLGVMAVSASSFGQTGATWTDGNHATDDNWSDSGNWSGGVVPNGNFNVTVPLMYNGNAVHYPNQDISVSINNLSVGTGTKVAMNNGVTLLLTGNSLSGGFNVNDTGSGTFITISGTLTYTSTSSGNCCLQLFNFAAINGPGILINRGTISSGTNSSMQSRIGSQSAGNDLTLQNYGTVFAGQNSNLDLDANGAWDNFGTIQSADPQFGCLGGSVNIAGGTITQSGTPAGQLFASSGDISLFATTIVGGTLATGCGGTGVIASYNATLSDLTIAPSSQVQVVDGDNATLQGTIMNNGTFTLLNNHAKGVTTTSLLIPSAVTIAGTGTVVLGGGFNSFLSGAGTLTNSSGHTISGQGTINVAGLTNQGTINAFPGNGNSRLSLQVGATGLTNTGTITSSGGGVAELNGVTVTNAGGTISAGSGTVLLDNNATILGGTVAGGAVGGNNYVEGKLASLDGSSTPVSVTGLFQLFNGDVTTLRGTIVNQGDILLDGVNVNTQIKIGATTILNGNGTLNFANDSDFDELIGSVPGTSFTNNSNIAGNWLASNVKFTNGTTGSVTVGPSAGAPAVFDTTTSFRNSGQVFVDEGTTLNVEGTFPNFSPITSTLSGGTYNVTGTFKFNNANIQTNNARLTITYPGMIADQIGNNALRNFNSNKSSFTVSAIPFTNNYFTVPGTFTNTGRLTVQLGNSFSCQTGGCNYDQTGAGTTTVEGTLGVGGGGAINITGGVVQGGTQGTATFNGNFNLGNTAGGPTATLTVGDSPSRSGHHIVTQSFTGQATAVLNFQIGGTAAGKASLLDVTGPVVFNGGTINITESNKYVPTAGTMITIVNAPSGISGAPATVNGLHFNPNVHWNLVQNATSMALQAVSGP